MGKEQWQNEHAVFAIDRMKDAVDRKIHPANDLDVTWRDTLALFQTGKMAFYANGAWALGQQIDAAGLDPELKNNVAFTPHPATGPEGNSIELKIAGALGLGHHLAKQADRLEAALEWARVWTSEEAAIIWAVYGRAGMGVIVPKEKWDAQVTGVPLFKTFTDAAAAAKVQFALGSPSKKVRMRSWNMWLNSMQALVMGKSRDEAVAEYIKWMNEA
jgi:ABC-type glycerol-3-phosphate transport system substrate-binding protein